MLTSLFELDEPAPIIAATQQLAGASIQLATGIDRRSAAALTAAAELFVEAATTAVEHGMLTVAVRAHLGAAHAHLARGDQTAALENLTVALSMAQEESLVHPFLRAAGVVRSLLLAMETGRTGFVTRFFRAQLLSRLGVPATVPEKDRPRLADPDELTDRELSVLRLLRGSLSNIEIAGALGISPNTLKTHLKHVYRKLGVTSRVGAQSAASQLSAGASSRTS